VELSALEGRRARDEPVSRQALVGVVLVDVGTGLVPAGESRTGAFDLTASEPGPLTVNGRQVATVGGGDDGRLSAPIGTVSGLLSGLPNPLALWPDGLLGTVLAGILGFVAVTYGILKALAVYLGY